jgi:hypothetical protein
MKRLLLAATIVAVTAFSTAASAKDYVIVGSAWMCSGWGWTEEVEAMAKNKNPSPAEMAAFDDITHRGGCEPAISDFKVAILKFEGDVAFFCRRVGKPGDDIGFYCNYALTRDLRDEKGGRVLAQWSLKSPSPEFFDTDTTAIAAQKAAVARSE